MEVRRINIGELQPNEGQITGLPKNPRQWKQREFDELKRSIKECPELLDARGCLVYPCDGSYIVIGGNMRLSVCKALKMTEVPCIVLPEGLDAEKLKEIAIKDNGSFGEWDFDLLANEWDSLPLAEWGVDGVPEGKEGSATERLSELTYAPLYYEPAQRPKFALADCVDLEKFTAKVDAIDQLELTEEQRKVMLLLAYRFIRIDFQRVADYYRWWATDAEKRALERLRCVLVDSGGIGGFIEDNLLRVMNFIVENDDN